MITEVRVTFFKIECDMQSDHLCYNDFRGAFEEDMKTVKEKAKLLGWLTFGDKFLCPSCVRKK